MSYKIGAVARLANISIRTLHHYDAIGLLMPTGRSESNYRLYSHSDLERLQQILFYKTLDFSLKEIYQIMSAPEFDRFQALQAQRKLVIEKSDQLEAVLKLIDKTIDEMNEEKIMNNEEMFEVFNNFDQSKYEQEAEELWGNTDAYKESAKHTKSYSKQDWQRYKKESEEVNQSIASLMDEGIAADDDRALAAIEKGRLLFDTWFYPCSREMHANLGRMYVSDPRFTESYDKIRPGMAQFICDAAEANYRKD